MATTAFNSDITAQGAGFSSLKVASGSTLLAFSYGTASFDFANMASNATSVATAVLTGAIVGRPVIATPASNWSRDYTNIDVLAQILVADQVCLTASNKSAGAINPDATVFECVSFSF